MCLICERIKMIQNNTNPYLVKELETGYVVIGDDQYFKGYTLFLCKKHVTELFLLEDDFRKKFMDEMSTVAHAVAIVTGCDKMNYELLGMGDAHLHWHLYPRYKGDLEPYAEIGPVWWVPLDVVRDEKYKIKGRELEDAKAKLKAVLEELLSKASC